MVDRVRLDADSTTLVNAINRGTEAWNRFANAQTQVVKESAKLTRSGVIVTRRLQSIDSQGRRVTATFRGAAGAMTLVSTSVRKTSAEMENARRRTEGFGASLKDIRRAVGFSLLFRSVTALTQALSEGTESAIEFSRRVAEIQTIQGDVRLSTKQWSDNLRDLSDSFGIDILTQAEAAYQTLSNQVAKGRDAFVFLESANRLALTAVTDTASSVNLLTSAINAFGLDVSQSDQISAQFFKTVELGRVRISELADIFGRVGVPAAQLGISIEEIQASISAITVQGVRAEEALTLIRNVILKLIRPTDDMKRIFSELGIASAEAGIAAFGFGDFLGKIEKAAGGTTTGLGKAFGRVRALTGALVFASESGAKAFKEALDELNDPGLLESFQKNFQTVFDSNGEVIRRETNQIRNFFQVELGQQVLESVANFTKAFGGLTPVLEATGKVIRLAMVPALALLSARLLTVGKSAAIGSAGLKAFALANPFTAIAVGGIAAIQIIDSFTDSAEKSAARVRKASEELTQKLTSDAQENRKAIIKEAELAAKALQFGTRAFVAPLTQSVGDLNQEFNELNKDAKAFNAEIKKGADTTLKAADTVVKQTENFIKGLTSTAKQARESIEAVTESTKDDVFELRLNAADPERQILLLTQRLDQLENQRRIATRQGDLENFNKTQDEIRKLSLQRSELVGAAQAQFSAEDRLANQISLRNELLEDELRLRDRILENIKVQEIAANRVRVEQNLLRQDLTSALETFRGGGLTSALEGSDEAQISRALSERQSAAERLIALQEKLGITQVGNNEIALSQQRDAENAANRIAAIRTNAIIKERQDLDKQIKARIEAAAEEQTIRAKSIGEEIEKLAQLRTALGTQVQLAGFAQSNITGGTDTTALTEALGRRSVSSVDALSNALQPTVVKINQLIGILQRDPSRVTPEQRSESNTLRAEILADIASIRGRDVTRESLETRLQGRLGTPEGGIAPLIGAPDRVSQEEIDKDIKAVLAVFDALEEGAKRLTAGTDTLLDSRLELQQAQEQAVSDAKAVTQAEKDRLNALEIGTDGQKENVKAQESLTDLLARRNALDTQTIDATVAAPQLANSYKSAVQAAAPDVKKSQIEAVIAAERERQRINAQATAGPDAAEKAAEATTQSAFLSRKIAAEERRDQRAAAIQNARDIQTARIEAAKKADEEERKEAVDPTLREQALGQEDIGQAAAALEVFERGGEAAAKAALKVAEQADVERRFGPTDAQIPSPLAVAPGRRGEVFEGGLGFGEDRPLGPQPLIKGTRELSDHFDTANSRLDLFNEQLQATVDILLGNRASDAVAKKERDFIPEVPVQDRQLGGTGSAIQSFTFDEDGSRAARLETLTREQDKAAQSLANLSIVIDNLLRRPSFFPNSIDEFVPNTGLMGFADGGQVPGIGNSDSVPAMLTPGEYVVDKETTRRFLPDLIRMRNMRPRRYQNGGSVSNVNFGGFNVTESNSPQTTALEIQRIINRGVRQGIIKIK